MEGFYRIVKKICSSLFSRPFTLLVGVNLVGCTPFISYWLYVTFLNHNVYLYQENQLVLINLNTFTVSYALEMMCPTITG